MKKFLIKYKDSVDMRVDEDSVFINTRIFDDVVFKDQYVMATSDDAISETLYIPYYSILNMKAIITEESKIDPMHP